MNNAEAIEKIKCAIAEVEWEYPIEYAAAFDKAIEAIEKQIPKKPRKELFYELDLEGVKLKAYNEFCPICGYHIQTNVKNIVCENIEKHFCENCGQRLDLEEEN